MHFERSLSCLSIGRGFCDEEAEIGVGGRAGIKNEGMAAAEEKIAM